MHNQLPLSENESDLVSGQQQIPIITNQNNYRDIESQQASEKHQKDYQQPLTLQKTQEPLQKIQKEFKLSLPNSNEHDQEEPVRTQSRQGRHGRVLIQQKVGEQDKNKQKKQGNSRSIKIYDLQQEAQEKQQSILENINDIHSHQELIPIKVSASKPEVQDKEESEQAKIEAQQDKKSQSDNQSGDFQRVPKLKVQVPNKRQEVIVDEQAKKGHKGKRQRLLAGIKGKGFDVAKGLFYDDKSDDEESYHYIKNNSLKSFDTGIQPTASREQYSSRNILEQLSPQKLGKKKLQSLKPLNETLAQKQQQLYTLKTYQKQQNDSPQKKQQPMLILSNGKYAIIKEDIIDVLRFVCRAIPYDKSVQTILTRNKACTKFGYLDYDLETKDGLYLISCKKMPFHLGSTYYISLAKNSFAANSGFLVGKVQGNFIGSTFNIFTVQQTDLETQEIDATVYYTPECMCCTVKSRQIQVYLKNRSFRYEELQGIQHDKKSNLKELYELGRNRALKKIVKYVSKEPKWRSDKQVYTINLRGKAKYASVKNMAIVNSEEPSEEGLLLAKTADNTFELDISYPFTPLVAVGVAMTSFDFKLASQ